MKILIIEDCNYIDFPTGGQLIMVKNLISALDINIALVGCSVEDNIVGEWHIKEICNKSYEYFSIRNVHKCDKKPLIPRRIVSFLKFIYHKKRILRMDFDYIFTQQPEILFALSKNELSKCIFNSPGVANPLQNSRYRFARYFSWLFELILLIKLKHVNKILASASVKEIDQFIQRTEGALDRESIVQFPTRYDEKIFNIKDSYKLRKKLGYEDTILILTVGRLTEFKGWKLMIDSFKLLSKSKPNAHLVFIGDGEDYDKILNYIRLMKLESSIHLIGKRTSVEISEYLNASDVFIMGSFQEGWSTTLLEACACGVPCVVSNFSSSEMVVNGTNGYIVNSRDDRLFSKMISMALELNRDKVIVYNQKYIKYALCNLENDLFNLLM